MIKSTFFYSIFNINNFLNKAKCHEIYYIMTSIQKMHIKQLDGFRFYRIMNLDPGVYTYSGSGPKPLQKPHTSLFFQMDPKLWKDIFSTIVML